MKVLLAIKSCHAHRAENQAIRITWLSRQTVDYKFFLGRGESLAFHDEVRLDCDDSYAHLPFKTQAILRWALERSYDYVFLCDTDTYVCVPRLLSSGFEDHQYVGCFTTCKSCQPLASGHCQCVSDRGERFYSYASGGSGYWVSAAAARIIVEAPFIVDPLKDEGSELSTRGEDLQVGWTLGRRNVLCHRDMRYSLWWPGPLPSNDVITLHDITRLNRSRDRMIIIHRNWLCAGGH